MTLAELLAHPDTHGFLRSIAANPDPLSRLQFADYLRERGFDNAAAGQEWAAKNNKAPTRGGITQHEHGVSYSPSGYFATHPTFSTPGDAEGPHVLPRAFWSALPTGHQMSPFLGRNDGYNMEPEVPERGYVAATHHMTWGDDGEPIDASK